jgi:hypothetical protein
MGASTSVTSIANAALLKLGDELLISIDDGSKRAESIKTIFDKEYAQLLRMHTWNFATKRILLPADAQKPAYDWERQFTIPQDFIRLVEIRDARNAVLVQSYITGDEILYQFEGGKILTNLPAPLKVSYIYPAPLSLIDASFEDFFACSLAYELAETVSRSNPKKSSLEQDVKNAFMLAKKIDTLEGPVRPIPDTGWVFANLGTISGGASGSFSNSVL